MFAPVIKLLCGGTVATKDIPSNSVVVGVPVEALTLMRIISRK